MTFADEAGNANRPFACPACGGDEFHARGWVLGFCEVELDRDGDGHASFVQFGDGIDFVYDWQQWTHVLCARRDCHAEVPVRGVELIADLALEGDDARRLLSSLPEEVPGADETMSALREELHRVAAAERLPTPCAHIASLAVGAHSRLVRERAEAPGLAREAAAAIEALGQPDLADTQRLADVLGCQPGPAEAWLSETARLLAAPPRGRLAEILGRLALVHAAWAEPWPSTRRANERRSGGRTASPGPA